MQPIKPMSPYVFYMKENLAKIKEAQGLSAAEAMRTCADQWSKLTEKQRKKYQNLGDKDRIRYENQTKMLHDKGFFIFEDGSKSTDDIHVSKLNKKRKRQAASQPANSESPKKK